MARLRANGRKGSALIWALVTMVVLVIIVLVVTSVAMTSYHRTQASQGKTQAYYTAESVCARFVNWLDGTTTAASTDEGMKERQALLKQLAENSNHAITETYGRDADTQANKNALGAEMGSATVTVCATRVEELLENGARNPYPTEIEIEVVGKFGGIEETVTASLALTRQTSFTEQYNAAVDETVDVSRVTKNLANIFGQDEAGNSVPGLWQTAARPAWQLGDPRGWAYFNPVLEPGSLTSTKTEDGPKWFWADGPLIPQTPEAVVVGATDDDDATDAAQVVTVNPYYFARASLNAAGESGIAKADATKGYYAHFIDKYTVDGGRQDAAPTVSDVAVARDVVSDDAVSRDVLADAVLRDASVAGDNLVVRLAFDYLPTVSGIDSDVDHGIGKGAHPDQAGYDWSQHEADTRTEPYPAPGASDSKNPRVTKGILLMPTVPAAPALKDDLKYQHAGVYYFTADQEGASPGSMDVTLGPWRDGNGVAQVSLYNRLGLYFTDAGAYVLDEKGNVAKDEKGGRIPHKITVQGGQSIDELQLYTVRSATLGENATGFGDTSQRVGPPLTIASAQLVFADPGTGQEVRQSFIGRSIQDGGVTTRIANAQISVENRHALTLGPNAQVEGPAGAGQTILVSAGGELVLDGATVTGNIVVRSGGKLTIQGSPTVTGDIFVMGELEMNGGTLTLNTPVDMPLTDDTDEHGIFLYNHPTLGVAQFGAASGAQIAGSSGKIHSFVNCAHIAPALAAKVFCSDRDEDNNICKHFDTDSYIWQKQVSAK
ncbi:MAG: polymer-forming cytoskeletal protein [Clostridiales Family XIII bacterium]|jgi:Tfp pilus assembly protein PilX|nr:polymer-forming cytoskeletal protein [Clostridiales Family XIII bacterium]